MVTNLLRAQTMLKWLYSFLIVDSCELQEFLYKKCDYKVGSELPTVDNTWKAFKKGESFGGYDKHAWFYKRVVIPQRMRNKNLYLEFKTNPYGWDALNPQFIVYINGENKQALDSNHTRVKLDADMTEFDLYLYAYTGVTVSNWFTGGRSEPSSQLSAKLIEIDALAEKVYYDIKVPCEILEYSQEDTKEYADLLNAVTETLNHLDFRIPHSQEYEEGLQRASAYADEVLYGKLCKKGLPKVACVGHTHIDIAWLWTVAQTREKAQRSFSTVLNYMNRYPEYKFMSSQAFLYNAVKEEDPSLYENIKQAVKEGRWNVEGSMWVEADCNLISGESLVRQVVEGKRFFKQEFGIDMKILWLPDTFGYSITMPQLMKKAGVEKFVTSKISWNDTNQIPYDMFQWKGLDGSEIFTYFLTAQDKVKGRKPVNYTTYNAVGNPRQVAGCWERFQQKDVTDTVMITYGYGDGGGGPTISDLEMIKRMSHGLSNCPTTTFETATTFLDKVYQKAKDDPRLPVWSGELYLEFHRGTYTSQAKNKRYNRRAEFEYLYAETLSVASEILLGMEYPTENLSSSWRTILTNQFHDIIPGSAIREVYEKTDEEYEALLKNSDEMLTGIRKGIAQNVERKTDEVVVFNPHSFENSANVEYGGTYYYVENVPAKGYKTVALSQSKDRLQISEKSLENDFCRIEFDENYEISSLYSKTQKREVLPFGKKANGLIVYEDFPYDYDAWEIENYHKEKSWRIVDVGEVEIVRQGARGGLRIRRRFMNCWIEQTIFLYENTERIDFETEADWQMEHVCLKTEFPVEVNARKAVCDVQFGSVERPITRNNDWEKAKFEVCAHKYVDLSDSGLGVTLMNDCKYGYDVEEGVMRLTLLKCATYPDPQADKGKHEFTYSLYLHDGNFFASKAIPLAYDLNQPMRVEDKSFNGTGTLPREYSLIRCNADNFIVETVKRAYDEDAIILRGYECKNKRQEVVLTTGFDFKKAHICNLMEENEVELQKEENNSLRFVVKPFEVITIKIEG